MIFSLIVASVLTAGVFAFLAVAFFQDFPLWSTLSLLGGTILTMATWAYYYIMFTKHKESLNPVKKKYRKTGNRKESRRKRL